MHQISSSLVSLLSRTQVDESIFLHHLMFNFRHLIEFLCLRIDLIRICDNWTYSVREIKIKDDFSCIKYYWVKYVFVP